MMGRQTPRQTVPVRWLLGASPCFDPLGMPHEDQSMTAPKGFLQNMQIIFTRAFKNKLDNVNKIENYLTRLKLIKISLVFLVMKIRAFFKNSKPSKTNY